ncbi:hypothetical protein PoB_004853800 [Plakobranchus ocellatus]|uniref:Uncharacterized protein n=1 Tax=Plakobranchus ocellatus TaxID=259542 RepID=A0AAV4BTC0_9GAST|nr:hypothetical protein PoB_004853800 [Plakobranchus ocellatus]
MWQLMWRVSGLATSGNNLDLTLWPSWLAWQGSTYHTCRHNQYTVSYNTNFGQALESPPGMRSLSLVKATLSSFNFGLRRSDGGSGRAVDYHVRDPRFEFQSGLRQFFVALLCPPTTKWVGRFRKYPVKVKVVRKAIANYPRMSYAKNNQDFTPGSGMLETKRGITLL